jgi:rhamnose utilization protein RhaD (predicted bifunctional aldolase and dehydrogenase)
LNKAAESSEIETGGIKTLSVASATELDSLRVLSERLGSDQLLVQAGTGNTSMKRDGMLWIKASGTWLAHAVEDEIFIPVNLDQTRAKIARGVDPAGQTVIVGHKSLGTSVETAMHAVLPYRVVLHVHSVNTIAWAVREDGPQRLAELFSDLPWKWIPYVSSGIPLAHSVWQALEDSPGTRILILANHGLVICGDDCDTAEALLREVERRVAITPRRSAEPDWALLTRLAASGKWRVPPSIPIHYMATDPVARRVVSNGIMYPCQAIFLSTQARVLSADVTAEQLASVDEPFVMIAGVGTLARQRRNPTESATLAGLALVLQRIPEAAPLRYLNRREVGDLLCADVYHYRERVEDNGAEHLSFTPGRLGVEGLLSESTVVC